MPAPHPRMHGITHVTGGPDPVPGLLPPRGTVTGIIVATLPGAYYKLNETTGGWADSSGAGRDAVYTGPPGTVRGVPAALDEDDGALCVTVPGSIPSSSSSPSAVGTCTDSYFEFGGAAPFTVSALIRPSWVPGDGSDFSSGICGNVPDSSAGATGWGLFILSDLMDPDAPGGFYSGEAARVCFRRSQTTGIVQEAVGPPIPADFWQRVTGVYDGAEMGLWLDDIQVAGTSGSSAVSLPAGFGHQTFRVGDCGIAEGVGGGTANFLGEIDSVIVWDRALTVAEIAGIIEAGQPGGGGAGSVLVTDDDGNPVWLPHGGGGTVLGTGPDGSPAWVAPPAPAVTVNGQEPVAAETPSPPPTPPPPPDTDPVDLLMIDQPFTYNGGTFTVQPKTWTTIPFTTPLMERMSDKTGVSAWEEIDISDPDAGGWLHHDFPHGITIPHDMPAGNIEQLVQVCLRIDNPVVQEATSFRALRVLETTHQKTLLEVKSEQGFIGTAEGGMTDVFRGPGIIIWADGDTGGLDTGGHNDILFAPNAGLAFSTIGEDWLPYIGGVQSLRKGMRLVAQCWHDATVPLTFDCSPGTTYKPHFVVNADADPAWGPPWSTWLP